VNRGGPDLSVRAAVVSGAYLIPRREVRRRTREGVVSGTNEPPDRARGFWRWVKNPRVRRRVEREAADEQAALDAFDPDRAGDGVISRLVASLLDRPLMWPTTQKFERLGRRAVPHLLRALSDPRFFRPYEDRKTSRLPVGEVLTLLDEFPSADLLGRLVELTSHPWPGVREAAARSLGRSAAPAALPAWLAASRDPDDDVKLAAVWGVNAALRAGRVAPEFAAGAFGRVAELLDYDGPSYDVVPGAAGVLVRLDPARARPLLLDPARFSAGNPRLRYLLKAADEHGFPLPPDRVAGLLIDLRPRADDYFGGSTIGLLLHQLARQRSPDAATWSGTVTGWATPGSDGAQEIGRAAAEASAVLNGVDDPLGVVLARLAAVGTTDRLTAPQQAYYVCWLLDAEVRNGGFAQYFVNTSGDTAGEAVGALEAVGATAHAVVVRRAVSLFGPTGPAAGREARHRQLAELTPDRDAEMARSAAEYYRADGDVVALLAAFAGRHPDHFRAAGDEPGDPVTTPPRPGS
jgi:hypothetical protein